MAHVQSTQDNELEEGRQKKERRAFLFLAVVLAPLISVILVGGYGFLIWMSQLLFGPPTV
ncbi:periplasmic nitrate reductase, NapE protein [Coralliovum pocilloporae]|uniref:periplasmic nitrate reductase, NapE protein n=1 Tax=Coralliovum pocilloporae TaxID=3066369 RepID=UPI0033071692